MIIIQLLFMRYFQRLLNSEHLHISELYRRQYYYPKCLLSNSSCVNFNGELGRLAYLEMNTIDVIYADIQEVVI